VKVLKCRIRPVTLSPFVAPGRDAEEGVDMRAFIEVLRSIALWFATGGVGMKPLMVQVMLPETADRESGRPATSRDAA
jgi:hypothetical protein